MTAINVLKTDDAVHLLTDGLVGAGGAFGTVAKVMPLPHLNAAIATRGPARLLGLMSLLLCVETSSFDDLAAVLRRLQWICGQMSESWQVETLAAEFDLVVAGIGPTGPQAYLVSNHNHHGFKPWQVFEIPYCLATPTIDQALLESVFWSDEPLAQMPNLIDAQCSHPSVGGFAQLTSVKSDCITTKVIRRY